MKLKLSPKTTQLGAALITALVIGSILCISIAGYLSVTEQQSLLSARSQAWNMAITVVEAGIEEGLQQCYNNYWNLSVDGWNRSGNIYTRSRTFPDGSVGTIIIDNTIANAPTVRAQATVVTPTFAQRRHGLTTFFAAQGTGQLGDAGTPSPTVSRAVVVRTTRGSLFRKAMAARDSIDLNGNNIETDSFDSQDPMKSRYGTYDPTLYKGDKGDVACNASIINSVSIGNADIYGHVATGPGGTVTQGANGSVGEHSWVAAHPNGIEPGWVTDDSNFTVPITQFPYDSSGAGVLSVPNNAGNLVLATNQITATNFNNSTTYPNPVPPSGVTTNTSAPWTTNSVLPNPPRYGTLTNTFHVTGMAALPNPGTYIPSSLVTNYSGQSGNIKTYAYDAIANYRWPSLTYNYTLYGTNTVYTTNHYDHIINTVADYYTTSLTGDTIVTVPGVRLIVANGMDLSANSHNSFTIATGATTGSAFQLYVGGTSFSISSDQINNVGRYCGSFIVFCAPSVTSMSFGGNSEFAGVLCAPNVNLSLNGGGSGYQDFVGSLIVKSVTMTGHYHFHWDEALGRLANNPRVLITSWDEVTPSLH